MSIMKKNLGYFTLFLSITVTSACFGEAVHIPLPTTKLELKDWLVGTEWKTHEYRKGKRISITRRFYPNGVMKNQHSNVWKVGEPIETFKYKVITENSIQYGSLHWGAVFNDDFTLYTASSKAKKDKAKGVFRCRFEVKK